MFDDLRLFCAGMAAVIDTALLLTLLDRRNWRYLAVPIAMLALGAWLFHTGTFVYLLMSGATRGWSPSVASMAMATGLMLMPSALLHGAARTWRSGLEITRRAHWLYAIAYVPLVALLAIGSRLWTSSEIEFLETLAPFVLPYVGWTILANLIAAAMFFVLRSRFTQVDQRRFFGTMATMLIAIAGILAIAFAVAWPEADSWLILVVILLPVLPAITFAFFVIRYNFMRLMIEQTIVYGAIVIGVLLFHRLVVGDVTDALGRKYGFDFGVVEGLLIAALVLAYRPFRERTSEALRYLLGSRVTNVRQGTRELAVELSRHAEDDPQELLAWFVESLSRALNGCDVAAWLFENDDVLRAATSESHARDESARQLLERLESYGTTVCSRRTSPDAAVLDLLKECGAGLAVQISASDYRGLLLLGHRTTYASMGDEEINAVLLLIEQLGVTLDNQRLRQQAQQAERRALENEKLSTMGLMTSCLAHEVKNPLSSIKTIATVMAEQLDSDSGHAKDLHLVLGEVDRLTKTTNVLLGFSRPADRERCCESLGSTLEGTVQLLSHEARRRGVEIHLAADDSLPPLPVNENAVREILLNLLTNSIDAAGEGGEVRVACSRNGEYVVTQFVDSGPGIAPEVQDRLFEPFATTKPDGSGLGLYIVAQRVQELGGEIRCESKTGKGTTFVVRLPIEEPTS